MRTPLERPERIFKYFSLTGIVALETWTLRFTRPSELNDPFEMRLPVLTTATHPVTGDLMQSMRDFEEQKRRYEILDKEYGVLSLTEDAFSLLMWAHYGFSHTGFSIALDTSHPSFAALGDLRPVQYLRKRPKVPDSEISGSILDYYFMKSADWEYEEEWRIVEPLEKCRQVGEHVFVKNLDPECVTGVALGMAAKPELEEQIRDVLNPYPHIPLKRAYLASDAYGIVFLDADEPSPGYVMQGPMEDFLIPGPEWRMTFSGGAAVFTRVSKLTDFE